MVRVLGVLASASIAATLAVGCGDDAAGPPRSCVGESCSGIGTCVEEVGYAYCACPPGYHPVGLTCVEDHASIPCDGVTCFDRGWCRIGSDGEPTCECFPGYRLSGGSDLVCLPDLLFPDAEAGVDAEADVPPEDEAGDAEGGDAEAADDGEEAEAGCVGELGGPCNPVRQCGCDPAEQCRVLVLPAVTEACGSVGDAPVGSVCNPLEDHCVPRAACLPLLGRLACEQICYGNDDCGSGLGCLHDLLPETGYGLCSPPPTPCDPFGAAGTDCPADHACRVLPGLALFTYCSPVGAVEAGGMCASDNCVAGSGCYMLDRDTPTCRRYCNLDAPEACGAGVSCQDLLGNGVLGLCP